MKIIEKPEYLELDSGEGRLIAQKTNRGEPYREGADITLYMGEWNYKAGVFLEGDEARKLRDFLNRIYPPGK